jgi:hypothetical protein
MYVNLLHAYKILWFVTIVERGYIDLILASMFTLEAKMVGMV